MSSEPQDISAFIHWPGDELFTDGNNNDYYCGFMSGPQQTISPSQYHPDPTFPYNPSSSSVTRTYSPTLVPAVGRYVDQAPVTGGYSNPSDNPCRPDLHRIKTHFSYTPIYDVGMSSSPPSTAPVPTPDMSGAHLFPPVQFRATPPLSATGGIRQIMGRIDLGTYEPMYQKESSMLSPYSSTPSVSREPSTSVEVSPRSVVDDQDDIRPTPREHVEIWKRTRDDAIITTGTGIFIPQTIYQPHTLADRERYIKKASLSHPIIFFADDPHEWGIPLEDALRARMKRLMGKDDHMFEDCGPSVSIRIQWPGYDAWTRQIPTKDFRVPKGPITKGKLAKNIANCVKRFIEKMEKEPMHEDADKRWRVGPRHIKIEDLILVSLHHISQGSWQPQLRLRRQIL